MSTVINSVGNALTGSTGSGNFVGATSPTMVTPALGVITATSINFGGSTLSTYVTEQSFSPTLTCVTPGDLSVSYTTQSGYYTQIGSMVFYNMQLAGTPTFTTASGQIQVGALPQTPSQSYGDNLGTIVNVTANTYTTGTQIITQTLGQNGNLGFLNFGSGVVSGVMNMTALTTGTAFNFYLSGYYFI